MLEPDNTVHGPLTHPIEYDAGGLHEDNPRFGSRIVGYVEDCEPRHKCTRLASDFSKPARAKAVALPVIMSITGPCETHDYRELDL